MIHVNHLSFSYTKQPFISDMTYILRALPEEKRHSRAED